MNLFTTHRRKWAAVSVCAAAAGVTLGAGASKAALEYFVQGQSASKLFILPGGSGKFDSDIARLDTRSGAVYRFHGNVDNPSVRNTWEMRVPPVKEGASGLLEIQQVVLPQRDTPLDQVEPTTFLVDIVSGQTWILRARASTNASWDPIETFKHSDWGAN